MPLQVNIIGGSVCFLLGALISGSSWYSVAVPSLSAFVHKKETPLQGALGVLCISVLSSPIERKYAQNQRTESNCGLLFLPPASHLLWVTNFSLSISSCERFALWTDWKMTSQECGSKDCCKGGCPQRMTTGSLPRSMNSPQLQSAHRNPPKKSV